MASSVPDGVAKLIRMGNPILRQIALPFKPDEINDMSTKQLVKTMKQALKHYTGVGLAAPQIGVSKQLLVIEIPDGIPNVTPIPTTVLFNPKLEFIMKHETIFMWESCLSVPSLVGKVPRYNNVIVNYLDESGTPKRIAANGYIAGVIQHEADHLSGTLYLDRLKSTKELGFSEEWSQFMSEDASICWAGSAKFYDAPTSSSPSTGSSSRSK